MSLTLHHRTSPYRPASQRVNIVVYVDEIELKIFHRRFPECWAAVDMLACGFFAACRKIEKGVAEPLPAHYPRAILGKMRALNPSVSKEDYDLFVSFYRQPGADRKFMAQGWARLIDKIRHGQ